MIQIRGLTAQNLEQFDLEWENHRPKKSKQQEKMLRETVAETADETADKARTPEDQAPNWHEICTNLLDEEAQRRQATGYGMGHEVNIYVPLGLVKPKQQARRGAEDADSREGMQQYQLQGEKEIEKSYAHQEFLDQVIAKADKNADKNLAIIGEPGAGKTTWLQQIVRYLTSNSPQDWGARGAIKTGSKQRSTGKLRKSSPGILSTGKIS